MTTMVTTLAQTTLAQTTRAEMTPAWATLAQATSSDQALTGAAPTGAATAQPGTVGTGAPLGTPPAQGPGFAFWLPLVLVMVFFIGMSVMASRRDKKRQQDLMSSLKRGDEVLTIGGIVATVAEVRDDHLLLRLDDSGTKVKVVRTAIQRNLSAAANAKTATPQVEVRAKGDASKEKAGV